MRGKHAKRWGLIIVTMGVVAMIAACFVYLGTYYPADASVEKILIGSEEVSIMETENDRIVFIPDEDPVAGMIFYPGGKVEYTAYAPLMEKLAEQGVLCVLVKMPFNLAIFNGNAAEGIQEEYPEVERWLIGGHSLGGVMASSYAAAHAEKLEGVVLLASYSTKDLTMSGLSVVSIYGSEDGVMNRDSYEEAKSNLPADAIEYVIEGGCHAGFGAYGPQKGDGTALISSEEQMNETVGIILRMLE